MRRTWLPLLALLVCALPVAASAGLDNDSDSFGVYFDTLGNTNTTTPMTAATKTVYILLMNPTTAIKGFELDYRIVPEAGMAPTFGDDLVRLVNAVQGTGFIDIGDSSIPTQGSYFCAWGAPRPAVQAMAMVRWTFRYYGEADLGMDFYLSGYSAAPSLPGGLPVILDGNGVKARAFLASGDPSLKVATTNATAAPVAGEINSFGSVKSLFR
jgi:hypothetical protein